MTLCKCTGPGYCITHFRFMSEVRHKQCKNEPRYFKAFALAAKADKIVNENKEFGRRLLCKHSLEISRTVKCRTCGEGYVAIPIYKCNIHGECSDYPNVAEDVEYCKLCDSYEKIEAYKPANAISCGVFDTAFCINLDHRPNRWENFLNAASNVHRWPLPAVERLSAYNGNTQQDIPSWWGAGAGAWGCRKSHIKALEEAHRRSSKAVFIFEDDAIFRPDFGEEFAACIGELPNDWHLFYAGGQYHRQGPEPFSEHLVKPRNVGRTHAWGWSAEGIEWALNYFRDLEAWAQYPGDHIDHYIGRAIERGDINVYCAEPWLVGQGECWSDISLQQFDDRFWYNGNVPVSIGPTGIFISDPGYTRQHHDTLLARAIAKELKSRRVHRAIDLGCGVNALYVKELSAACIESIGVDGNSNTDGLVADLTQPQNFDLHDAVLSLEVGEHIPAEFSEIYLNNIVRHARHVIIMSWAVPGQSGKGHINCQSNEWVIQQMGLRNWQLDERTTEKLRRRALRPWFKQTLLVFIPQR